MKLNPLPSGVLVLLCLASAVLLTVHIAGQATGPIAAQGIDGAYEVASKATVDLGRLLFWDPVLSGNSDVACATCHHPDFAYADGRDLSLGTGAVGLGPARRDVSGGRIPVVKRNSPTVLNTAFNGLDGRRGRRRSPGEATPGPVNQATAPMLWDSRIQSLEAQALEPIKSREEMRGDAYSEASAIDTVMSRLRANPEYVSLFKQAFGPDTSIDAQYLGRAIAAFERSLVAMNSPFDRFAAGDQNALTAQQRRGRRAFDAAGCDRCHEGTMFSDFEMHAEGVRENPRLAEPDAGTRRFRFRTPTLRNVALTAPYMHNGMLATLEDVLRFYDNGRSENPNVTGDGGDRRGSENGAARLARRFVRVDDMSEGEMRDIVAFLESLSDTSFDKAIPARVPSGLPPGGLISPARALSE
jgi:cytochrome c peroxidase